MERKELKPKQFLYSIRDEQREIKIINDRIEEAETELLPKGIRYDAEKVQSSPNGDPMTESFIKIEEYIEKLQAINERLSARKAKAVAMINKLENSKERAVLTSFFLSETRKTMYQVSVDVGYSERETYRIYKSALKNLQNMAEYDSECQSLPVVI